MLTLSPSLKLETTIKLLPMIKLPKKIKIPLTTLVIIVMLGGLGSCLKPASNNYLVKRVSDGDTITLTDSQGGDVKVRFACIDAPEIPHTNQEKQSNKSADKNQFSWGFKAEKRLEQLVKQGGDRVVLTVTDTDQYGRKISEVRLPNGTFIQEVLVKEGLAMVYRPYLKNCPSSAVVEQAEAEAKKSKRGVWGDSKFVPAWQFRKENKK